MDNFIIGIVSGLITSVILFLYNVLYKKALEPYYANLVYRGIKLEGTWRGVYKLDNNAEIKVVCDLTQSAFDIKGVFFAETIYSDEVSKNYSNQYNLKGSVKNNILVLVYEAANKERTGSGVLMLKIINGGNSLKGKAMHSEQQDSIGVFEDFIFNRD